jgi:hypothetical protein
MGRVVRRRAHSGRLLAVLTAVAVGGALLVGGPATAAAKKATTAKVSDGTLAWGVSKYVLGANPAVTSLSAGAKAVPPATYTAGTGWELTDGTGTFATKTGATTVTFKGAIEFGNTDTGNFGFQLASPTVTLDGSGNGTLSADVAVRLAGVATFPPATRTDVVTITGATLAKTKKRVTMTVTPTGFSDAFLAAATDQLSPFFTATGSANDVNKPPEPFTLSFAYRAKPTKS